MTCTISQAHKVPSLIDIFLSDRRLENLVSESGCQYKIEQPERCPERIIVFQQTSVAELLDAEVEELLSSTLLRWQFERVTWQTGTLSCPARLMGTNRVGICTACPTVCPYAEVRSCDYQRVSLWSPMSYFIFVCQQQSTRSSCRRETYLPLFMKACCQVRSRVAQPLRFLWYCYLPVLECTYVGRLARPHVALVCLVLPNARQSLIMS